MKRATPVFALLAPLLLIGTQAWTDPAQEEKIKTLLLPEEQRILVAVLADPAEAKAFKEDAAAGSDAGNASIKWRARVAAYANSYLAREPKTNLDGKKLWEMVEPSEWAYVWNVVKQMEPGLKKSYVIGMIEDSNADLAKGKTGKALDTIKTARGLIKDEFKTYVETDGAKAAAAKAAPILLAEKAAREARSKDALEQAKKIEEAARKAAEQAKKGQNEDAANKGGSGYTGEPQKDPVVVVPPGKDPVKDPGPAPDTGTGPDPGPRPDLTLAPSTPPGKKVGDSVPPPDMTGTGSDPTGFEAELGQMKKTSGPTLKKSITSAVIGAVAGAVIGALLFGVIGAVIGAVAGAAGGWIFARKAL